MDEEILLFIRNKDSKDVEVRISQHSTILNLKEKIENEIHCFVEQQKLIFRGKILNNDLSLGYYGISNNSIIYIVITPEKIHNVSNPRFLIEKVKTLLQQIKSTKIHKRTKIVSEIKEILEKPTMIAFISFSKEAAEIAKEATEQIKMYYVEPEVEKSQLLAQQTDISLNQIEASSDGLRTLQHFYEEELEDTEIKYAIYADDAEEEEYEYLTIPLNSPSYPTIVPEKPKEISHTPLPALSQPISMFNPFSYTNFGQQSTNTRYDLYNDDFWSEKDMKKYMKQKYSQQIAILKYLGFEDEQNIIKALGETNGNVQLAYQILQNQVVFSH